MAIRSRAAASPDITSATVARPSTSRILGDRVAFAVALPYTQPSDAGFLIGGEGLERTIVFALRDVNGAETSETWPVVIANRPPELVTQVGTVSTNHVYDATAGAYLASAKLSGWRDPDGDPMVQADFTGDAACPSYTLDVSGRAAVQCSLASAMSAVVGNFVGAHDIQQRVRDPWAASPVASVSRIEILNRPPVLTTAPVTLRAACVPTQSCCAWEAGYCMDYKWDISSVRETVASFVVDPDGDPVHVTLSPAGSSQVCLPSQCTVEILVGPGASVHGAGARHLHDLGDRWSRIRGELVPRHAHVRALTRFPSSDPLRRLRDLLRPERLLEHPVRARGEQPGGELGIGAAGDDHDGELGLAAGLADGPHERLAVHPGHATDR